MLSLSKHLALLASAVAYAKFFDFAAVKVSVFYAARVPLRGMMSQNNGDRLRLFVTVRILPRGKTPSHLVTFSRLSGPEKVDF
jgi:hypothetical protein